MTNSGKYWGLLLLCIIAFAFCFTTLKVNASFEANEPYNITPSGKSIKVSVASPKQNQTYPNDVPLSFSFDAKFDNSTDYSVVYCYNLDGKGGFDVFGNPVFTGETIRIGQFYQPVPLTYNSSIHVSTGKHTLFVMVTIWTYVGGQAQSIANCSEIVKFNVSPQAQNQSPSPTVPEQYWLAILPLCVAILFIALIVRHRKIVELKSSKSL